MRDQLVMNSVVITNCNYKDKKWEADIYNWESGNTYNVEIFIDDNEKDIIIELTFGWVSVDRTWTRIED